MSLGITAVSISKLLSSGLEYEYDPTAELIPEVAPGRDLSEYIQPEKSAFGRGGMHSKYTTASKVQQAGIRVIIANGERDNILVNLIQDPKNVAHTEFIPYGTH